MSYISFILYNTKRVFRSYKWQFHLLLRLWQFLVREPFYYPLLSYSFMHYILICSSRPFFSCFVSFAFSREGYNIQDSRMRASIRDLRLCICIGCSSLTFTIKCKKGTNLLMTLLFLFYLYSAGTTNKDASVYM